MAKTLADIISIYPILTSFAQCLTVKELYHVTRSSKSLWGAVHSQLASPFFTLRFADKCMRPTFDGRMRNEFFGEWQELGPVPVANEGVCTGVAKKCSLCPNYICRVRQRYRPALIERGRVRLTKLQGCKMNVSQTSLYHDDENTFVWNFALTGWPNKIFCRDMLSDFPQRIRRFCSNCSVDRVVLWKQRNPREWLQADSLRKCTCVDDFKENILNHHGIHRDVCCRCLGKMVASDWNDALMTEEDKGWTSQCGCRETMDEGGTMICSWCDGLVEDASYTHTVGPSPAWYDDAHVEYW